MAVDLIFSLLRSKQLRSTRGSNLQNKKNVYFISPPLSSLLRRPSPLPVVRERRSSRDEKERREREVNLRAHACVREERKKREKSFSP